MPKENRILGENEKTGILLHADDIKLHRQYFEEMCNLLGIKCIYRSPKDSSKTYDLYGELDTHYNAPELISCIYDNAPTQWTMRKLGWNAELNESVSIIHVPYDLKGLQAGCLFIIPTGIDKAEGRVFKVIRMSNIAVYPASIACELGPVMESNFERSQLDLKKSNFSLLEEPNDDYLEDKIRTAEESGEEH